MRDPLLGGVPVPSWEWTPHSPGSHSYYHMRGPLPRVTPPPPGYPLPGGPLADPRGDLLPAGPLPEPREDQISGGPLPEQAYGSSNEQADGSRRGPQRPDPLLALVRIPPRQQISPWHREVTPPYFSEIYIQHYDL